MGLPCFFSKQVDTFLSKREGFCKTKRKKNDSPCSTICGRNIRNGDYKMLDIKEQKTLTMKLKFIRNRATFKVTNGTHEIVIFDPKEMLGIVDLRSLGYYKIKKGVLQQNLSCMYHFESANTVCD